MKKILPLLLLLLPFKLLSQPVISFTFDDGITRDMPGYTFEEWNKMLLDKLDEADIKAVFFVTGYNKSDDKGRFLLESWDEMNHKIANHTFSHKNYNNSEVTYEAFTADLLRNDSIIRNYNNYTKLFRFPYLKEGNTPDKVDRFRGFMKTQNYRNGYVTIDASDWYVNSRLIKRLTDDPNADIEGFKRFYLQHLFDRATFYEDLSYKLTGRHISHTILLHHNLVAALFLDDLIAMFKAKGWEVVSADKAYSDPIFNEEPVHAGESLIWSLAKGTGKYEDILRYPAEDSRYEKAMMDSLGL